MIDGKKIRKLRKAKGLTSTQLAEAVGTSQAMIAYTEQGKKLPSVQTLAYIADSLGVTMDELRKKTGRVKEIKQQIS